jgi:hypothetical protein
MLWRAKWAPIAIQSWPAERNIGLIRQTTVVVLGGLNTLIGTPPNILVSEVLRQYGEEPFKMFDYTPTGIVVMAAGIAFMC